MTEAKARKRSTAREKTKRAEKSAAPKKTPKKAPKGAAKRSKKAEGGKTLAEVRESIRARYERPVVIYENDAPRERIRTRFSRLNVLLGGGLIPGTILELFGFEDSGKSSTSIALAADVQRQAPPGKRTVVLVNFEGPQPYPWWRKLGLDTTETGSRPGLIQLRPRTLEEGIADSYSLVKTGEVCAVIYDSVYAASAKGADGMMESWATPGAGDGTGLGLEARQWGKAWTALKTIFLDESVVAIAVNQMREKIETGGGPRRASWAKKPTTTPRGHALKFYAWIRIEMQGRYLEVDDKALDGKCVRMRIVKNKTSEESRGVVDYDLVRGVGFDLVGDLIELGLECGLITGKGGGFYAIGSKKIRGKDKLRALVEGSPELQAKLSARIESWMTERSLEGEQVSR